MNPQLIFVADGTWKTFDEFVAEARKRPLVMGMAGMGTVSHMMALLLEKHMNLKFNYVPFSGSSGSLTALAGKHIDATFASTDAALGLARAQKIRPLIVCAFNPDPNFPDVPRSTQYNIPTIVMTRGVFGPPKIPANRVRILEKAFARAAAEPKLVEWVKSRGMESVALDSKQYRQVVEKQQVLLRDFKDVIKTP
jgi:tripartite-type tricarboxylate transporter receptor subunit TctC